MQKLFQNILCIVAILLAIFSIASMILIISGFRPFILHSESMEPLYQKGSLVWVDTKISLSDIKPDDVLVYRADTGAMIMHRLVSVHALTMSKKSSGTSVDDTVPSTTLTTFKGDANTTVEEINLTDTNLIGKEFFTLPWLGTIINDIIAAPWIMALIIGAIILIACCPDLSHSGIHIDKGFTSYDQ